MSDIVPESRANSTNTAALPSSDDTLIGVVLRPPGARWNGRKLLHPRYANVDVRSVAGLPGIVQVVAQNAFVGIVARSTTAALDAAARLEIQWDEPPSQRRPLPNQVVWEQGNRESAAGAPEQTVFEQRYRWPIAPPSRLSRGWAVASWDAARLTVWTNGISDERLLNELSEWGRRPTSIITDRSGSPVPATEVFDAAADAALLSCEVGRPVRVDSSFGPQLNASQPLETQVRATFDAGGQLASYELFSTEVPSSRPSMARLLSSDEVHESHRCRAAVFPYCAPYTTLEIPHDVPIAPAQSENALIAGQVFAYESFMDEAAHRSGQDPAQYRLAHLNDAHASALIRSACAQADWSAPLQHAESQSRRGRGMACARVVDEVSQPARQAWSVWVAEITVDASGTVDLTRVTVGHHVESMREAAVNRVWAESHIAQELRTLLQGPAFDDWRDAQGTLLTPLARGKPSVSLIETGSEVAREGSVAWSAAVMLPAAAALANAIFNATGVRLREPPFRAPPRRAGSVEASTESIRKPAAAWLGGMIGAAAGVVLTALPWRAAIQPVATPDTLLYSAAAVERGRLIASVGACAVCHTAPGGAVNAGGLPLATPFGTIYTTNITPDPQTGIGQWSYPAFERAMRQGIHRDGRHLYPAFPYTSFAKLSDGDLQALYAFLMTRTAVQQRTPETRLPFPLNVRALLGGWNLLFHDSTTYQPNPLRTPQWNRGRYLVDGPGHCGACHTPRNVLGAEKSGIHYLAGGRAEGWEAPPLNAQSRAPLSWAADDLYQYLRHGFAPRHGVAAGPMAPVVGELAVLPDSDLRAIAEYLISLQQIDGVPASAAEATRTREELTAPGAQLPGGAGERIFQGACAVCHEPGQGPTLFGSKPSLALNTNLHSDVADNLVQVILQGIANPAHGELGYMPGFGASLNDTQIVELVRYLRGRFTRGRPAWINLGETVQRIRHEHDQTLR